MCHLYFINFFLGGWSDVALLLLGFVGCSVDSELPGQFLQSFNDQLWQVFVMLSSATGLEGPD